MHKPQTIAFIPARAGSKSVRDKNIHPLGGHPVLAWSIAAARMSRHIERVIVSTDSEAYADIARQYGAEAPFLRPAEFATDASPDRECILHAWQWLKENEGCEPEYWVHLRPTTPLRDPALVDAAIERIMNRPDATALRSAHPAPETPFKWFQMNDEGFFEGLRPDDPRPEYYNLPKQAFPTVYIPDGYVDVIKASHFTSSESLHGDRIMGFESPVCTEIDSAEELDLIEYQLGRQRYAIHEYLNEQFS